MKECARHNEFKSESKSESANISRGMRFEECRLKLWRQLNQRKFRPMADFSRASSQLHEIATNLDCFVAQFAPAVIGRNNYFGICWYL